MAFAKHIGLMNCFTYGLLNPRKALNMHKQLADVLDAARPDEPKNKVVGDGNGNAMSNIMCDYQAGISPSEIVCQELYNTIESLDKQGYFSSTKERDIIQKTIEIIFDPLTFSRTIFPIHKGAKLLKACAHKKNSQGQHCHEMMILSNWDLESFEILKDLPQNKVVFQHFKPENIVISGAFGSHDGLKPHKTVFEYVINLKQVKPSDIVFIDDQEVNIAAARACGIKAVHLKDGDYHQLKKDLKKLGVL